MSTPNQPKAAPAETPKTPETTIAAATTPAEIPKAQKAYPDIDALSTLELRELIINGVQAREGLNEDTIKELDARMSYAHLRLLEIKAERDAAKPKTSPGLRRLTLAEANHIAHMCSHGPTDPRPVSQPLIEMGLVEFYDDTDSIEQSKLGSDCLYGPDRLKYIPAEWMTSEERKRAGF